MCYQSFKNIDIQKFLDSQQYDLIVLDEVHHLARNNAWAKNVMKVMDDPRYKVLGITAENKRSDNTRVADILFKGKVCKGMTTAEFLKSGVFWPISYVSTLLTVPQLKLDPKCAFLQRELDLALNLDKASDIIRHHRPDYTKVKGIVFIPRGDGSGDNFKQARELLETAYGPGVPIEEINYKLGAKECSKIKAKFEAADYGFIIAIDMLSEGVHFKGINCVIILRNAQSPLVVNQQIGRLTRIKHEYEQDPECILFDLVNIIKTVDYRDLVNRVSRTAVGQAIKELAQKSSAVIYQDQCEELYKVLERSHTFTQVNLFDEVCPL
jgi:superfamily II DNA or RNA helicase